MHLLYKGVFSCVLDAILTWKGPWNMPLNSIQEISQQLYWKSSCPSDFNRKPRQLEVWCKYKATELRRLLLYDAVVAFHGKFHENGYKLLLLLHCAVYILASPYLLPRLCDNGEIFLRTFVEYSAQIFGPHFFSYDVLADECTAHRTLEEFSAFPYENALKSLKETLRSSFLPLEQIVKRDSERAQQPRG
ncbi:hypothetical protein FOCC_FOCC012809 [Frankliniella occidentalis]|nr:hypothetical protein FOCC_FOCC012809 [Frankliniella occidentalis]